MATATGANTLTTLNGLFKETYAKNLKNLIPDGVQLLKEIPFVEQDAMPGNFYHQPVILGQEHGVTFAVSSDDAFSLQDAVNGAIKDAQVRGSALVLRSVLGLKAASSASTKGPRAFELATKFLVQNMLRSVSKKLEIELIYGQVGYGVVQTAVTTAVTVTLPEWAPGIWAGAENMPIEIRDITGATSRGNFVIASVNMDTRVLTLTTDAQAAGVVATDIIWHKGAYGNEFAGLHKILTNTGSLFNIDASVYALWKGNSFSASSAVLSFQKLQDAIARGVEKGLDSDVMVLVNPKTWADLLTEQSALRMYDSSYKSDVSENGSKSIKFHGQNGAIEVRPSIYVKESYAYIIDPDTMMRVGSSDITFKRPGKGDEFFRDLENHAGYELRAYCDQALFCNAPGRNILITNISN